MRELENILERAVALCDGNVIRAADLRLPRRDAGGEATPPAQPAAERGRRPTCRNAPLENYIDGLEREDIHALEERYNKTAAAKRLGITFRALRYRLKKLGID